ncbi:MAG TPA: hypothetical protein VIO15_02730, partial [Bacteroidales bacterium]
MRTKNLFRSLIVAIMATASFSLFAQPTGLTTASNTVTPKAGTSFGSVAPANEEFVDIVTLGSKMPYAIDFDASVKAMSDAGSPFWPSVFKWTVLKSDASACPGNIFRLQTSNNPLTADDAANGTAVNIGYFKENTVAVYWNEG